MLLLRSLAAPPANSKRVEATPLSMGWGGSNCPEDWVILGKLVASPRDNARE